MERKSRSGGIMLAKILYKLFLALMIALFIGFGIAVFYEAPKEPDYPVELQNAKNELTTEQKAVEKSFEAQQRDYQDKFEIYSRNVSAIAIAFSIVLLIIGLMTFIKIEILRDGILFAGIMVLVYGIIRSFMSDNSKYQFAVVSIGLLITIILGYLKFIKEQKS
jgi:uncharacterized membrane-anchored protein YhcB (DUF1043 family)